MSFPILVSVTRLRRETSDVVRQVAESGRPAFVTQYGSVALVLLTRSMYQRLLRAAETTEPGARPGLGREAGATPELAEGPEGESSGGPEGESAGGPEGTPARTPTAVLEDPLAVFGRLPPGTLFETKYGYVRADTAAFLMEEGETVKPYLSPERLQAALDARDDW
jgi:prevent-host-death family protein